MRNPNDYVVFENISSDNFIGRWNGIEYPFKAGETKKVAYFLAAHFAKHLATDHFNRLGETLVESDDRKLNYIKSCIHELLVPKTIEDETERLVEELNEVEEEVVEEEEFEELKEKTNEDIKKTTKKASSTKKSK